MSEQEIKAEQIVAFMLKNDAFSHWLGLEVSAVKPGYCKLSYVVKREMLNGFKNIHGGVLFSASDSAFAFACNTHGNISVALDVSITYTKPAVIGERLIVIAEEQHLSNKIGLYLINTYNESGALICSFKGTAYRTGKLVPVTVELKNND